MALPQSLLVVVGDELLGGFTADRNGPLAARRLFELGYPVRRVEIVGDCVADIAAAVRRGVDDSSITRIVVCGGIGPTPDDRTHEAVALALGRELVEEPEALRHISAVVARMHAAGWVPSPTPTAANRRMALMAAGGQVLENRRGMAPPLAIGLPAVTPQRPPGTRWDRWLFVLPGVPREFAAIFEEVLVPQFLSDSRALSVRELHRSGAVEADFADPLRRLEQEFPDVSAGSYPQQQGDALVLVLRLRGEDPARVAAAAERLTELSAGIPVRPSDR
jgi:molybdenum cofactor synthesis domain-containing protein